MLLGELIITEKFDFNKAQKAIQSGQAIGFKKCAPFSLAWPGGIIKLLVDKNQQ